MFEEVRKNNQRSMVVFFVFLLFSVFLFLIASTIIGAIYSKNLQSINDILNQHFVLSLTFFLILTTIYLIVFFSSGDKIILKTTGAQEVSRKNYPYLFHTTEALAISAGISPAPKCYVISDSALNAFATGFKPEKSSIVVTTGLMDKLNRQELEGVLAHEMSHIKNQDIKLMLYVAGLIGVFTLVGTVCYYMALGSRSNSRSSRDKGNNAQIVFFLMWILFSVIGVFFATIFKFALSREREYLADANGALLTRYPPALASALKKISQDPDPLVDNANKATAHLFISTPFRKKAFLSGLFATHPPIQERIKRLEEM